MEDTESTDVEKCARSCISSLTEKQNLSSQYVGKAAHVNHSGESRKNYKLHKLETIKSEFIIGV